MQRPLESQTLNGASSLVKVEDGPLFIPDASSEAARRPSGAASLHGGRRSSPPPVSSSATPMPLLCYIDVDAGTTLASCTNAAPASTSTCGRSRPLDNDQLGIKVMDNENKPKAGEVVKRLIAEDGWKGLYRGLGPRFFSSSAWGTSMIVCYEYLKRLCAKVEEV